MEVRGELALICICKSTAGLDEILAKIGISFSCYKRSFFYCILVSSYICMTYLFSIKHKCS